MILRYIKPRPRLLASPRLVPLLAARRANTTLAPPPEAPPPPEVPAPVSTATPAEPERKTASFFISNVFPIMLARWDIRPSLASWREESLMERLHDIASEIKGNGFQIESWEIARKDGGVLLHFSYIPPAAPPPPSEKEERDLSVMNALPEQPALLNISPGRLFLPQLIESAERHGGFPFWLGQWWSTYVGGSMASVPGHKIWRECDKGIMSVGEEGDETKVKKGGSGLSGVQAALGGGRVWLVKGRQWTEDMNRFPSNRLRVEFDGPDLSQEMMYILFRPYGRIQDIQCAQPGTPAGALRFANVSFSRLSPATVAITTLHGYSTPTNTADFTLRAKGEPTPEPIKLSRLRIYYERPLKAHAIRDWISGHPRIALPVIAFLIGTLSYTFFDPIRAFFVRSKVEGVWDLEKYTLVKWVKDKFGMLNRFNVFSSGSSANAENSNVGKNAWKDRVEAERSVERWLSEFPSTFIYITGPPGSGKTSLADRVLQQQNKPSLVIDCAEVGKSKNDAALLSSLAEQTGYYPVFSFLNSINGLIDLFSVGLIGQKTGLSTPVDQQLRSILEVVGAALRDTSAHARKEHLRHNEQEADRARVKEEHERRRELIKRGGWHDGRLDCVAGNGVMSELGLGEEPAYDGDLLPPSPPLLDDVAPIQGEAVPPTADAIKGLTTPLPASAPVPIPTSSAEIDEESELIKTLPIVVLKNFAQKTAKGDLWNVLAEWGASLVENKVAHVIVVTEGPTGSKALTKALPTKPLNTVSLADADEANSLAYVRDKLSSGSSAASLSSDDSAQISKLGGRMVDLETLVYKVRTGSPIKDAVDDIVRRNVVELRKQTFGDDADDAKTLPWTRAQAWKIVSSLAKSGALSYAKLLQEFPFKGAESSLKAMEEHELIGLSYFEGRPSLVRPGKPVFRYAFQSLVNDPVFKASSQIEYNTAVIAKAEGEIRTAEDELSKLQGIIADGGNSALGIEGWLKGSAIKERARWLLEKMSKGMEKVDKLEEENAAMMKVLSQNQS